MLIIVAMAVCVVLATTAAMRSADEADAAERLAATATAVRLELSQGHAALFRAVNWRANDAPKERIDGARREATAAVDRADAMTRALPVHDSARAPADNLKSLVGKYRDRATSDSVAAIKEIGTTIGRIAEIATTIATAVEEQGAAAQEISRNVQQAAKGTTHVAATIADVNRGAGETGSASNQVHTSAKALSAEGNKLKAEVDRFLATVRAA